MKNSSKFLAVLTLILIGAFSRLIPHPYNFTPIVAIGLFGGYHLSNKWSSLASVWGAMLLSDLVIGIHSQMFIVYAALIIPVLMGQLMRSKESALVVVSGAATSSLSFFFITNLGVWLFGNLYASTLEGLGLCLLAGIPFLQYQLAGDLLFSATLFGIFRLAQKFSIALAEV